jgi:acetyltransferase
MVSDGVEVIVGAIVDDEVGPVLMLGVGGVFVEELEDVSFRGVPVTRHDARQMIDELKASNLLRGARGQASVDEKALVDLLVDVSEVIAANPDIHELDLNPVLASPDGVTVLDASIQLSQ